MQPQAEIELNASELAALIEIELLLAEDFQRRRFVERYYTRPDFFVSECIVWAPGQGPYAYQPRILMALNQKRRIALRGPRGATKTTLAAWAILWFALTRDQAGTDWKCGVTAGSNRQLIEFLSPEIRKWALRLRWDVIGRPPFSKFELLDKKLRLAHGHVYLGATKDSNLIEGLHADEVMAVLDESKAIDRKIFDSMEGAFQTGKAWVMSMSTPGDPSGYFYDIFERKPGFTAWAPLAITLRECVEAGQISLTAVKDALRRWGRKSRLFETDMMGIFPTKSVDALIPLRHIELAFDRWYEWRAAVKRAGNDRLTREQLVEAGQALCRESGRELEGEEWAEAGVLPPLDVVSSDVCTGGRDSALEAPRHGWIVPEILIGPNDPTRLGYSVIAKLKAGQRAAPGCAAPIAVVDSQTVGAGVPTLIEDEGFECIRFNGGQGTKFRDLAGREYAHARAAGYGNVADLLDPANGYPVILPPFEPDRLLSLSGDLAAPRWWYVGGGRITIESKNAGSEEMGGGLRKRLRRSTDAGDTVMQALWPGEPDVSQGWWIGGGGEVRQVNG